MERAQAGRDLGRLKGLFHEVCDLPAGLRRQRLRSLGALDAEADEVLALLAHDRHTTCIAEPVAAAALHLVTSVLKPGDRCGAWTLQHELGRGGMGRVFLAERSDGHYQQRAALKLLLGWSSPEALARLARERQILATLSHPHIAGLLDGGTTAHGQPFLVMEYADGTPIDRHCEQRGATLAERLALMADVCEAVDYAHRHLVIHCDIKPANVLVDVESRVKLLDFGIAQLRNQVDEPAFAAAMTPSHASPEQRAGRRPGIATDVYSLGRLLDDLTRPLKLEGGRSRELKAIVRRATAEEPEQRYLSVKDLAADLRRFGEHRPVRAVGASPSYRLRKLLRRRWPLIGMAAMAALALGLGLGAALWQRQQAEQAARESAEVTRYLSDMLASAKPSNHGGQWPTVLALLERSREDLSRRLAHEPDTLWRLRHVLAATYRDINRPDIAWPMAEQQLALARERYGATDARTLESQLLLAHVHTQVQAFDKALELLEPMRQPVVREFGDVSLQHQRVVWLSGYCYGRMGRFDEADRMLSVTGRLTWALFPEGSEERMMFLNAMQVLRVQQGRFREAMSLLKQTRQQASRLPPGAIQSVFAIRRNMIALPIRIGEYDGLEAQAQALLADIHRVLGNGNDTAEGLHSEMARFYHETGQFAKALQQRDAAVQSAVQAGVQHAAVLLPVRALRLPAAALAGASSAETLAREARVLLAEMDAAREQIGHRRLEAWMEIARLGLLLEDEGLADAALQRLRADRGLNTVANRPLAARLSQLEGERARLQGDLAASAVQLHRHLAHYEALAEPVSPRAWSAALDLTYTLLLQGQLDAARKTLQRAQALRPRGMPPGVPLDHVQAYFATWLREGRSNAPAVVVARTAVETALGRRLPSATAPAAWLAGAFF